MTDEEEIVFLFKILILGFDNAIDETWKALEIETIPDSENVIPGVKFGINTYSVPINNQKYGTKIFYCSFNPIIVSEELRKSYYRGANGVLLSISASDSLSDFPNVIFNILEVNRDILPIVNLVFHGIHDNFDKTSSFFLKEITNSVEKLNILNKEKINFGSISINNLESSEINEFIFNHLSNLIRSIT